jgi:hypothetical protein
MAPPARTWPATGATATGAAATGADPTGAATKARLARTWEVGIHIIRAATEFELPVKLAIKRGEEGYMK